MNTNLKVRNRISIEQFTCRSATWDDLEAVTELINTWSQHYLGVNEIDVEENRREWETPGFNLETNTRLMVTEAGGIVGYYDIWDLSKPPVRMNLWGRIHPDYECCGLGTHLLNWGVERARQSISMTPDYARVVVNIGANTFQKEALKLFSDHGFSLVRQYKRMVIDLNAEPEPPIWPDGITVRSIVRGQDERNVIHAQRESFRDHWGYVDTPFEDSLKQWMTYIDDNPDFDPELWFIAEEGDEIAGIALCWKKAFGEPDMGWVGTLGVLRPWRRCGLGLALLRHSIQSLYQRGLRKVGLGVDAESLTGATRLYEKAGMHSDPNHEISLYGLELRPGIDITTQDLDPDSK